MLDNFKTTTFGCRFRYVFMKGQISKKEKVSTRKIMKLNGRLHSIYAKELSPTIETSFLIMSCLHLVDEMQQSVVILTLCKIRKIFVGC